MDEVLASSAQTQLDLIQQTSNPSKAEAGAQKLSDDFDNFLLLLTTQLENQDPTEPLDTNEFTNQLVQFSIAEQAIATNTNLEALLEQNKNTEFSTAVSYIGKTVDAEGSAGELTDGVASFIYELESEAYQASVVITDGAGRAVFSGQGPTSAGKNRVIWDGKNSFTGNYEEDGTYFINVLAKNGQDETITSKTYTTGLVTSTEMRDGEMVLNVAGTVVPLSKVQAVRVPTTVAPTGGDTTSGDETADETEES